MIEELNRYFVPVTSSNDGPAPPAEKAERQRIYEDFIARKLGSGTVHVYILRPDSSSLRGLDIVSVLTPGKLVAFLDDVRRELRTLAGPPAFVPHMASIPPPVSADSMVFHLVARGSPHNSWDYGIPSENWVVLNHTELSALLPPEPIVRRGSSWTVESRVADILLMWFYPQVEDPSQLNRSTIVYSHLHMTVTTIQNGAARARIEGRLKLSHPFYPNRLDDFVSAQLIGFMDFVPREGRIQRLRLITKEATYKDYPLDVALRSVSHETLDALR